MVYSKLKLRQLNQGPNGGSMDFQTTGLTNSMMGGGLGVNKLCVKLIWDCVADGGHELYSSSSAVPSG